METSILKDHGMLRYYSDKDDRNNYSGQFVSEASFWGLI